MPRTLAIGDIHGCLSHLDALLNAILPTSEDHLVFLGDYVDRGPDSATVLSRIIQLSRTHTVTAIQGNHEEMMLAARQSSLSVAEWLMNGGDATLQSYGGSRGRMQDVPAEHWAFLENQLVPYLETETHIFVHASVYPDHPMDEQPGYILRWERCDHMAPHESGKVVVCGHTPQLIGKPWNRGYCVCIDTCAYGRASLLTCFDVTSGRIVQANKRGEISRFHITDFSDDR